MNTLEAAIHSVSKVHYLNMFCIFVHDQTHWNIVITHSLEQINAATFFVSYFISRMFVISKINICKFITFY